MVNNQTIYALSSGQGRAGVSVVRISGPAAFGVASSLGAKALVPRRAHLVKLAHPVTQNILDHALVMSFPKPASFTGEDVIELHLHGGRAVVAAVLNALSEIELVRAARPGEFTERAFEFGKLDLSQVEALSDLIDSDTEQQRLQAIKGLEGYLGQAVSGWKGQLLTIRALIAAQIDFADEGDVPEGGEHQIDSLLQRLGVELAGAISSFSAGRIISEGLRVAIVGAPNVGKSTLLNALAGSELAIVTDLPGTTRDVIEVKLDLDGFAVILFDTAGVRVAADPIEQIGIQRTLVTAQRADCLLHLDDRGLWNEQDITHARTIRIRTKSDMNAYVSILADITLSAQTGLGLYELRQQLISEARNLSWSVDAPLVVRERQAEAIRAALEAVQQARAAQNLGIEFMDQSVGNAIQALSRVVGEIDVEDVLGDIFSRFCIGK
jgi:tRNA modification GTPase